MTRRLSVRQPPTSAYEQTKTEAHAIALAYQRRGLPLLIACPGNVIGPDDHAAWGYYARLYVNGLMPPMAWAQESIFAHASVGDTAEGIALVAERGHPGETYFLGGDLITMKEVLSLWSTTPGGLKRRLWVPTAIAAATFAPLEPLQRLLGIPAFSSRESARGAATTFAYSNAKARQALGWNPRPPREVWLETLRVERELRARRKNAIWHHFCGRWASTKVEVGFQPNARRGEPQPRVIPSEAGKRARSPVMTNSMWRSSTSRTRRSQVRAPR